MALTGIEFSELGKSTIVVTANGEVCFYCGTPCTDPAWVWDGWTGGGMIYMHVSCALNLGVRMMHDIWIYQKRTGVTAVSS